jgi:uncharacterized membrane protein (UPF0127 family)
MGRKNMNAASLSVSSRIQRAAPCNGLMVVAATLTIFFPLFLSGPGAAADQRQTAISSGIRPDGRLDFLDPSGSLLATVTIEIADTQQARSLGLMWRIGLDDTMGMLFIFEQARPLTFWMRNTPTSLDMIFVSADKEVINIAPRTRPLSDTVYSSQGAAQYVVEVPAGFCMRYQIRPHTRVRWQRTR